VTTKFERPISAGAIECLVADERWIPSRAFESFSCFTCPSEEIAFVNQRPRGAIHRNAGRNGILLQAYDISMMYEKLTVTARRVEKAIVFAVDCPCHK
jgi:hypothetical protein